ncbi:Inactive ubiquitin carboxyl-terminal hydrolase MINDY-4B [Lamellibrachia satsuma]|nr:Inactive ubiquitin carboxyl-terminal hydrolase MINDY-4B [Lamellibrachia satsuma]
MRRHLQSFEEDGARGCILFIYSVVLSRTIPSVYDDAGTTKLHLIGHMEEATVPLVNLLLTGRASKYIHNGTLVYDKDGEVLEPPLVGLGERSEIGLLFWEKKEDQGDRTEVGSMYRTPKTSVWVTWINQTQFGVLFCLKSDLVSDWRAENWFTLNYYNGLPGQPKTTLTIDTRTQREVQSKTTMSLVTEEKRIPLLEQCILSKWPGSAVNWNGVAPFV